ncbi:MAG: tetraacyldisaccharide 4'-kinase [Prevotellaceae bacterium]|jgi:tetraacyldisaccharide 4'-kinase|nr:tetraacyldisaccharide 4'-kinase [Prevotellaceae bacterium]
MYALIIFIRNLLFDFGILKSKKFEIPLISVGNITMGGTGKTPHIEHFIRQYLPEKRVAVLSRGYKRKTKGFILADENADAQTIGDEPFQIFQKFPEITVAVDENRVRGVENLLALPTPPEIVLLDDAFQHRKISPSENILLINYNRPIFNDRIFPYGRLREFACGTKRADSVIVTKCPQNISEKEKEFFIKKIEKCGFYYAQSPRAGRSQGEVPIYFSAFEYSAPKNIFTKEPINIDVKRSFLVVTGVVNASGLYDYLENFALSIEKLKFSDHHDFTKKDIEKIEQKFSQLSPDSLIITTEKDRARLLSNPFVPQNLKEKIFYVEIEVKFL